MEDTLLIYIYIYLQLIFELAWTSFGQREYAQAGDLFVKMTQENNWSHATYRYIAACGNPEFSGTLGPC